jgi:uncharacterized protein (TIGR02996 family)
MGMDDVAILLRNILETPACDTARGVYADYLQEHGEESRAEFIRVQCELARRGPWPGAKEEIRGRVLTGQMSDAAAAILLATAETSPDPLQRRADALLREHANGWRRAGRCECKRHNGGTSTRMGSCPVCDGTGDIGGLMRKQYPKDYMTSPWACAVTFRRGFIERVEVPTLAECVAEEQVRCEACGGPGVVTKFRGPGATNPYREACLRCGGTTDSRTDGAGYVARDAPSAWLRAVLTATPERGLIAEVAPADREPEPDAGAFLSGRCYDWYDGAQLTDADNRSILPAPLFALVAEESKNLYGGYLGGTCYAEFPTRGAAILALARALVRWGRAPV